MSVLRVRASSGGGFGGEIPRVPARELPPGAAILNQNLLATATEFRPMLAPAVVADALEHGTPVTSPKTLWRRLRGADGAVRTNETTGWLASASELNIIKGPLVDDATERAYLTFADGSFAPRASDISNEGSPFPDRLLGVPRPAAPTATVQEVASFTQSQANGWLTGTLVPAIRAIFNTYLDESLPNARFYGGASTAGVSSITSPWALPTYTGPFYLSQRGLEEPWFLILAVDSAAAAAVRLNDGQLGGIVSTTDSWTRLAYPALPFWGIVRDTGGFKTALGNIPNPRDPSGTTKLWAGATLDAVAADLAAIFSVSDEELKAKRDALDAAYADFNANVYGAVSSLDDLPSDPGDEPLLTDAAYAGWINQPAQYIQAETPYEQPAYTNAAYDDWKADHDAWLAASGPYKEFLAKADRENISRVAAMVAAFRTGGRISHEIEAIYAARKAALATTIEAYLANRGLALTDSTPNGLVALDPDPIYDSRFYGVTWVTDWGEESMVSPLSAMVEPDQNDTVLVAQPSVPSGRNITQWRIYRANTGADLTLLQLVTTLPVGTASYTDALKSGQLQTITPPRDWAEPPVRTATSGITNTNPYLRGLTSGPNGVAGGFIDNFVAFCEPYRPYAWPARYQIPLAYPVVGLRAFGQSWLVGTQGNPYVITGSEPGSYTEQKLDDDQACVSARGMVAAGNGVFFPSPDGYCLGTLSGVEVVTQGLFAREDWQALDPKTIYAAAVHDNVLYFWHTGGGGGCWGIDFVAKKLTRHTMNATAVFKDVVTDGLYATYNGQVFKLFAGTRATGIWDSGTTVLPAPASFAWLKIVGDQSADAPVTFKWYADGTLRHTVSVTGNAPVRLPMGRYLEHRMRIESKARVTELVMASSTAELQSV